MIKRDKGIEFVKSTISIWIAGLNEFIYGNDRNKALSEFQIENTADILSDRLEFSNITVADLSLVFKKAYAGDYGKLYGRLRPDIIISWFIEYFNERCNTVAEINYKQHLQSKNFFSDVPRNTEKMDFRSSIQEAKTFLRKNEERIETEKRIKITQQKFNEK
ncbi:hypothetical protein [Tenacibaculum sp. MAR_2009_124]|uniref:hypothetical protein n=1 Tax=Tenacibaculum sp. MAR_2009_124 TaxID=1250059 RepID=UPI00115FD6A4|nr:hypothetical protein [Tenacibaculum sp. MAR_2009_124]